MLVRDGATQAVNSFAEDVRDGLGRAGQKELPSKHSTTTSALPCLN